MMDLDDARRRIQEAADVAPLSDILLDLLTLIGGLDDQVARQRQRLEALERIHSVAPLDLSD